MRVWWLWWACAGAPDPEPRSRPVKPTKDLTSSSLVIPADSPLAPFVPKGEPAWPLGVLGRFSVGLPLEEVRRIAVEIRSPHRPPDDVVPAPGVLAIPGQLAGVDHVGFVATCRDGRFVSLDVVARNPDWDGVLEAAWGPGVLGGLKNGIPITTWTNPATGLQVTQARNDDGRIVVKWELVSSP